MRSWFLLIALSALLALTAACGNDDDDTDDADVAAETDAVTEVTETATPEPEPEPEPTETPVPEPTPTEAPEPEPTETPEPAEEPEPASNGEPGDLDGLLLSVDDLPAGWTEVVDEAHDDIDVGDVSDDPFDAPCGIEPLEEAYEPIAEAERSFQGTELGPFLSQNLMQLNSASEAEEVMGHVRELFGCEEWSETDEFGDEVTFEVTEVPFEGVGEDSFAVQLGLSFGEDPEMDMFGEFAFEIVFLQRNEYISMFMFIDIFGMSEADFGSLVQLGDEKLQ